LGRSVLRPYTFLEVFGGAEGADYGGGVVLVGVDFGVHVAHVGSGDFSGEVGEGCAKCGEFCERVAADDGDGVVGREIVAIVGEADEMERVDEAVGGIAGDDVDFLVDERAVNEAEVHHARRFREMQTVTLNEAAIAVGAFEKFVADAGAPAWGDRNDVGDFGEMELFGIGSADDHGKCVFESERLGDVEIETLGVALFHALVDGLRVGIVGGSFAEDGGERGAGVFDIKIEVAGEEGFLAEERAAEIGFAIDVDAGAGFDVLGEEFGEEDLLGEKFGSDGDVGLGWAAGREAEHTGEQKKDCAAHGWECLTV
jgi:hypothetical protein